MGFRFISEGWVCVIVGWDDDCGIMIVRDGCDTPIMSALAWAF